LSIEVSVSDGRRSADVNGEAAEVGREEPLFVFVVWYNVSLCFDTRSRRKSSLNSFTAHSVTMLT
jgi:hypothetical protein